MISQALKKIGFWSNRANDAYSMGEADWVYGRGGNFLTGVARWSIEHHGDTPEGWESAAFAVESECKARGIDPKRHRWRPPQ